MEIVFLNRLLDLYDSLIFAFDASYIDEDKISSESV